MYADPSVWDYTVSLRGFTLALGVWKFCEVVWTLACAKLPPKMPKMPRDLP